MSDDNRAEEHFDDDDHTEDIDDNFENDYADDDDDIDDDDDDDGCYYEENDYDMDDCFNDNDDDKLSTHVDPEDFKFESLTEKEVEIMVSKQAQETCEQNISASKARMLLHSHDWEIKKIVTLLKLPEMTQNSAKESECLVCFHEFR